MVMAVIGVEGLPASVHWSRSGPVRLRFPDVTDVCG